MAEKRLIDANALMTAHEREIVFMGRNAGKMKAAVDAAVKELIYHAPTVDAVEVVRCKDCEYRHDLCFAGKGDIYCDYHHRYFGLDDFCSYGERRTDG